MDKLIARTHGTTGSEYITDILCRYRAITISYVILEIVGFIITAFHTHPILYWIESMLGLLIPIAFALVIYAQDENKIKLSKYALIVGFAGHAFCKIIMLYSQTYNIIYTSKNYSGLNIWEIAINYIALIILIISFIVALFFLLILIFNFISRKIATWLCVLIIIGIVLSLVNYIYVFAGPNYNEVAQESTKIPEGLDYRLILNQVKFGISILTVLFWKIIELLIVRRFFCKEGTPAV